MKEHYLAKKVRDMFHVKHSFERNEIEIEDMIARIMNIMRSEILIANQETERKLLRKMELLLRDEL